VLTAHLPSGYVLARLWPALWPQPVRGLWPAALIGAVLPDLDMLWFHLIDHGAVHHHRYWVHVPAVWALAAAVGLPLLAGLRSSWFGAACVLFVALQIHLLLDTISGGILWGWPFDDHLYSLLSVPATRAHWVLSFLLHWSFALELAIWTCAGVLWWRAGDSRATGGRAMGGRLRKGPEDLQ